jgi:hypothetical protein
LIAGSYPDEEDMNCGLGFLDIRMLYYRRYRGIYIRGNIKSGHSNQTDLEQRHRFDL